MAAAVVALVALGALTLVNEEPEPLTGGPLNEYTGGLVGGEALHGCIQVPTEAGAEVYLNALHLSPPEGQTVEDLELIDVVVSDGHPFVSVESGEVLTDQGQFAPFFAFLGDPQWERYTRSEFPLLLTDESTRQEVVSIGLVVRTVLTDISEDDFPLAVSGFAIEGVVYSNSEGVEYVSPVARSVDLLFADGEVDLTELCNSIQ